MNTIPKHLRIPFGVKFRPKIVTPKMAQKWLDNQLFNRPLRARLLKEYLSIMRRRGWLYNGMPILFDKNGRMFNGQHRCKACVESGESFITMVGYGLSHEELLHTLDGHGARTDSEFLGFQGYKNCSSVCSIAKVHNKILRVQIARSKALKAYVVDPLTDYLILLKFVGDHPGIQDAANFMVINKAPMRGIMNASLLGAVVSTAAEIVDPELAFEFGGMMATGENLTKENPIYKVRNRFIANANNPRIRLLVGQKLNMMQRAWAYWVTDTPLNHMPTAERISDTLRVIQPGQSVKTMYPPRDKKKEKEKEKEE